MQRIKVQLIGSNAPECVIAGMSKPYKNDAANMGTVKKVGLSEKLQERHGSVLEHIVLTFDVLGSSRLELQEHMRHRLASPTVESTRYVLDKIVKKVKEQGITACDPADYFVQPSLAEYGHFNEDQVHYFVTQYRQYCMKNLEMMTKIHSELYTSKKDNDLIKYFLPENLRTNFTWTINLRSLINFLHLRTNPGAHFEIRHIAGLIIDTLKGHWCWPVIEEGINEITQRS